jgi:hypothetical protein
MTSFDDVLKRASMPSRVLPLCLAGEILEEIDELERQLESAPAPSNLGDSAKREIAEAIVAAQERMRESTVEFHLRAMPVRGEDGWTAFAVRQPDRAENETRGAFLARIFPWHAELVSRTCTDPVMSVEQVGELCDVLHGGAWNALVSACLGLNGGKLDIPNSEAASALTRDSEPA